MTEEELQAYEARARSLVTPCEGGADNEPCRSNATKRCCNSECRIYRCDKHAVFHSGYCDHEWRDIDNMASEVLALVAEVRRKSNACVMQGESDGSQG